MSSAGAHRSRPPSRATDSAVPSSTTARSPPAVAVAAAEWTVGRAVWIPDSSTNGFLQGTVLALPSTDSENGSKAGLVSIALASGGVLTLSSMELAAQNPISYDSARDIADLPHLNEPAVLHHLSARYLRGEIYTYSGLFLVAVNPYRSLPIYTPQIINQYKNKRRDENDPHVYAVAEKAWQNMRTLETSQSVLVTGESGAGKTENTKKVIQYLAAIAQDPPAMSPSASLELIAGGSLSRSSRSGGALGGKNGDGKAVVGLEKQILLANPILEAFGNAQTVKNNNSSRFGKFVRIFFNSQGAIEGANIDWYLLEKSRVTARNEGERSFHIFFQLLKGSSKELREQLLLSDEVTDYDYLGKSRVDVEGVDDREEWRLLCTALDTVGFTLTEQDHLFRVLSAILHLGNLHPVARTSTDQASLPSLAPLEKICQLLELDLSSMTKSLLRPRIKAGREWVEQSRTKAQVRNELDALAKALHERLFGWIVSRINKSLEGGRGGRTFIGVLDIAGFEIFEQNGFEQLCINLTNERLQQFFNHHMFVLEQLEYEREGIKWEFESFGRELQGTIDLIEGSGVGTGGGGTMGVLAALDDACFVPKGSEATFITKLDQLALSSARTVDPASTTSPYSQYTPNRFGQGFTISHYAGKVDYTVHDWLEKNRDPLSDVLGTLMAHSRDPFTRHLFDDFAEKDEELGGGKRGKRGAFRTVGQKHKDQLATLMSTLNATQPHFIRCLVPNLHKSPKGINEQLVLDQLRCNGVLEGIRISRKGFPNRVGFVEFRRRFQVLVPGGSERGSGFVAGGKACERILGELGLEQGLFYQVGLTKIFFKAGILAALEQRLDVYLSNIFTQFQARCRGFIVKRRTKKDLGRREAIQVVQRNARLYIALKQWEWWGLFVQVRPLLGAVRNDEELKRREAELEVKRLEVQREKEKRESVEREKQEVEEMRRTLERRLEEESKSLRIKDEEQKRSQDKILKLEADAELALLASSLAAAELSKAAEARRDVERRAEQNAEDSGKLIDSLRAERNAWKVREKEWTGKISVTAEEMEGLRQGREAAETASKGDRCALAQRDEELRKAVTMAKSQLEALERKWVEEKGRRENLEKEVETGAKERRLEGEEMESLKREVQDKERGLVAIEGELKRLMLEQATALKANDALSLHSTTLEARVASLTKNLSDATRSLEISQDTSARTDKELLALKKLLGEQSSDQERLNEGKRILEGEVTGLRDSVELLEREIQTGRRESESRAGELQQQIELLKRDKAEQKRALEEATRERQSVDGKVDSLKRTVEALQLREEQHVLEVEVIRTTTAALALQERDKAAQEIKVVVSRSAVLEADLAALQRTHGSSLRDIEAIQLLLEQAEARTESSLAKIKTLEADKRKAEEILLEYDTVNQNQRAEVRELGERLRIAEGRGGVTVVEHIRVLEEAQRLQNLEIARMRNDEAARVAYVRTLERARTSLTQSLEDVQHERDAEKQAQWRDKSAPKDYALARAQDALAHEKRLREDAELNITRLRSEIQQQQTLLETTKRETVELRRSNTLFERELNTLAASDQGESVFQQQRTARPGGYESTRISTRPISPTKFGAAGAAAAASAPPQSPRRRFE